MQLTKPWHFFLLLVGVTIGHLLFFIGEKKTLSISMRKSPIQVQTYVVNDAPPKPKEKAISVNTQTKKKLDKVLLQKKTANLSQKLLSSFKKASSSQKIANNSASFLPVPCLVDLETNKKQTKGPNISEKYSQKVVQILQENLHLIEPERVKLELTINAEGKILFLQIVTSKSRKNSDYLKKALPDLIFPCFNKSEKTRTFTINLFSQ